MEENQDELDEEEDEEQGQERKTKKYFGTWFYRLQKRRQHNKRKRPKLREKELPTYKSQYDMERRLVGFSVLRTPSHSLSRTPHVP